VLGVVAGLALTYEVGATSLPAWPILPAAVAILLPISVWRAARRARSRPPAPH